MALTPHKDYESYVSEAKAKGERVVPKSTWNNSDSFKPASPESSSPSDVSSATVSGLRADRDETGALRKSDTMELIGNAGAGLDSLDVRRFSTGDSRTILYDDVTGSVYATGNWSDVDRNEAAWVDSRGQRFKGWGSRYGSDESENSLYSLKSSGDISMEDKKAGQNMLAVFGSGSAPQPGTAAFQDWVREEISRSAQLQAEGNTYDPTTGQFGDGTDYGHYGQISVSDWVKLGRPDSIGGHTLDSGMLESAAKYTDSQLAGSSSFIRTMDTEQRKSGIEKSLGSTGAKIFNIAAPVAAGFLGPGSAVTAKLLTAGTSAYSASGGDWGQVKNAVAIEAGTQLATAAITAATAGVGGAVASGVGGVAGATAGSAASGAATGAISSFGSATSRGLLTRLFTGNEDSGMWRGIANQTAMGASTGAIVGGVGRFVGTDSSGIADSRLSGADVGKWQTGVSGALFDAALRGSTAYGVNRLFGTDQETSVIDAATIALGAFGTSASEAAVNRAEWQKSNPDKVYPGGFVRGGTAASSSSRETSLWPGGGRGVRGYVGRLQMESPIVQFGIGSYGVASGLFRRQNKTPADRISRPGGYRMNWNSQLV